MVIPVGYFGKRYSSIKRFHVDHLTCPHCKTQGKTDIIICSEYTAFLVIPLVPHGKFGISECRACGATYASKMMGEYLSLVELSNPTPILKFMSADFAEEVFRLKPKVRIPFWHYNIVFFGILVAAVFGYAVYFNKQKTDEYFADPRRGDVYELKLEENDFYTIFKVDSVGPDSLWGFWNDYSIDQSNQLYKIDKPENYSSPRVSVARDYYLKERVVDIDRY